MSDDEHEFGSRLLSSGSDFEEEGFIKKLLI